MKKILLIITILCSLQGMTQTLVENKTDDFTKATVKRTSWEKLVYQLSKFTCFIRFSKIDTLYYLDVKIMEAGNVFSIDKDSKIMLKLSNDTIYTLNNLAYVISSIGDGAIGFVGSQAMGIETSYISFSDRTFKQLETFPIKKIRIYTTDGYLETDVLDKFSNLVINSIKLLR